MYRNIGYVIVLVLLLTIGSEAKNCWKIKNNDTKRLCESKFEGKRQLLDDQEQRFAVLLRSSYRRQTELLEDQKQR